MMAHEHNWSRPLGMRAESRYTNRQRSFFETIVFLLLSVLLLVAIVSGVGSYAAVSDAYQAQADQRVGLNLIASNVRASDAPAGVVRGTGPEGDALVLVDKQDDMTYETRIYQYQGNIVEEYAIAGTDYTPAKAQVLVSSQAFSFKVKDGLLTITTDQGTAQVALRHDQGSA